MTFGGRALWLGLAAIGCACRTELPAQPLLVPEDRAFLEGLARDVVEASRVPVGESAGGQGPNSTGRTLIRPGGREDYPAFWIRDYAMSLDCGVVPGSEQLPLLLLTAAAQSITAAPRELASGSCVPSGSIPDHITFRGVPIFFPGTLDDDEHQGGELWGRLPPLDDAFYFVHMAREYVRATGDLSIWTREVDGHALAERLWFAVSMPPRGAESPLVRVAADERGVGFGFDDSVTHTGELLFASALAYQAFEELGELCRLAAERSPARERELADAERCAAIAAELRTALGATFATPSGLLRASTGTSSQPDVWGTAFAVYVGALEPDVEARACAALAREYTNGHIAWRGSIRHVPTNADARADSAWERSLAPLNRYQNGAYWSTPTGWVAYALAKQDRELAARLFRELVADLRAGDFRKGAEFGAPWECQHPDGDHRQNPIYMTSVTCPLAALQRLESGR